MIREIVRDPDVLSQVSFTTNPKSKDVQALIKDLLDTANAHKERCVGLAAIQIGLPLRVCVVFDGDKFVPFVNPVITRTFGGKYATKEGCMSIDGLRDVTRFHGVEVMYQTNKGFVKKTFSGYLAEILQHEIDHLNGVLI